MNSSPLVITSGNLEIHFHSADGGMPSKIFIIDRDGVKIPVVDRPHRMEIELLDGTTLHPVLQAQALTPEIYEQNGATHVDFIKIPWCAPSGQIQDQFFLSLRYEFYPDGTAFTDAMFHTELNQPANLRRFEVQMPLNLASFPDLRWAIGRRLARNDGAIIQSIQPERYLPAGADRIYDQGIVSNVNFCCRNANEPGLFAEFIMEGDNTISGDQQANESSVVWSDGNPILKWNFQNKPTNSTWLPLQWRNRWGWYITMAPTQRHLPPLRMYHYLDLAKHYPTPEEFDAVIAAGCDLFIVHENWRFDIQNDGVPFDRERLVQLIQKAHDHGIRVALYMRGREISIDEDYCSWFSRLLTRNFDGLYMDYGCPLGFRTEPDETYQNGRILFRRYYLKLKKLREQIGPDGVFYTHTGPLFCSIGLPFVDGYISGEGERGIMVKGRPEHEYFSMAYAWCGTMWTAAFPEYSSPVMVPHLAATGQYPHSPLGIQFPSSSLMHPPVPGINDVAFRPLWKLWSCFRHEKDLTIYNNYNSRGIWQCDSSDIGFYLQLTPDKKRALLIVTNFAAVPKTFSAQVDFARTGLRGKCAKKLEFSAAQLPQDTSGSLEALNFTLPAYGVAGMLVAETPSQLEFMLDEFRRPYPALAPAGEAWLQQIAHQKQLREQPPQWDEVWLKIVFPWYEPVSYEDSMTVDLFDEEFQLGEFTENGEFKPLGWIGRSGFSTEPTTGTEKLHCGLNSAAVPLHKLLPQGEHHLGLCAWHLGDKFYSFIEAELSSQPEGGEKYRLTFFNDLEPDRAFVRWHSSIK